MSESSTPRWEEQLKSLEARVKELEVQPSWVKTLESNLKTFEERVKQLEDEGRRMREEMSRLQDRLRDRLRDQLAEEEGARREIEEKLRVVVEVDDEEKEKMKREIEEVKKVVKDGLKSMEESVKEVAKEIGLRGTPRTQAGTETTDEPEQSYPCIILVDSNGKDATEDTIKSHIPMEERSKYHIKVVTAFRLEDAYSRIREGEIDVKNAYVVIDNYTNNVRGDRDHAPESVEEVTRGVAALRELILARSAKAVVVCQLKPMRWVDVRPYANAVHEYLDSCGKGGYGCFTQIRMDFLKNDGFHVRPQYESVVDRTYACAIRGKDVPDPTPFSDLTPEFCRRRWETQWPKMGGRGRPNT